MTATTDTPGKAYMHIRDGILNRRYVPGQRLTAQEIAQELGLSRTPVREALGLLEQNGLVEKTGWGFVVRSMTLQDIEDLFDIREILELEAARKALANTSQAWVEELRRILAESLEHLDAGRQIESIRTARGIYVSLARRSENLVLTTMLTSINDQIQLVGAGLITRYPDRAREILVENQKVVAAIEKNNVKALTAAVLSHIRRSRELHLGSKDAIRAA